MPVVEKTLEQKMAEKKAMKTVWDTDKKTWEYISIPAENALGETHATIRLNDREFTAGETYLVPADVATFVKERMHTYNRSCVRVLQPTRDISAERIVNRSGPSAGQFIDPNNIGQHN